MAPPTVSLQIQALDREKTDVERPASIYRFAKR